MILEPSFKYKYVWVPYSLVSALEKVTINIVRTPYTVMPDCDTGIRGPKGVFIETLVITGV